MLTCPDQLLTCGAGLVENQAFGLSSKVPLQLHASE